MTFLVIGVLVVAFTSLDLGLTILHPSRRGPITTLTGRLTFDAWRLSARLMGRPRLLSGAGAAAMAANLLAWVGLLWLGYALIYLPYIADLAYTPDVDYGDRDLWEALYFSGVSLTTVGYGDVVAETEALRIVSVLEAATGFGVMTAAITYVLSVLPRVSAIRRAARSVYCPSQDAGTAADVAQDTSYLVTLQQQILQIDEETERFPILYYFHAEEHPASLYTFLRGAVTVCLQCRWGLSPEHVPHARRHGEQLRHAIAYTRDHYATRFMHGKGPDDLDQPLCEADARRLLEHLAASAGEAGVDSARAPAQDVEQLARFAGRCEKLLEHVADQHLQPHRPLVDATE